MADTIPIESREDFVSSAGDVEENTLDDRSLEEIWEIWDAHRETNDDAHLLLVPEWFSGNEFGARRPYSLVDIEFDDEDRGAILFSDAQLIDISIAENQAFEHVELEDVLEVLDISDENDYIDEPGKIWIPRSLMVLFEPDW